MKSQFVLLTICSLLFICMNAYGQYRTSPEMKSQNSFLSGNLKYDLMTEVTNNSEDDSTATSRKVVYRRIYSPMKAALFSVVIPGAGQFYTKSYGKSALYFGAEVLMWVLYATNQNKGDKKTESFENFADDHWSAVRYAHWMRDFYPVYYNSNIVPEDQPGQDLAENIPQPWLHVNLELLNIFEETNHFSHKLESYGEQQYYEMIGKYPQFLGGWDDARNDDGTWWRFEKTQYELGIVSQNFLTYSQMRGDANKLYNIATTISYIIVANHIFSALEAAWNASKINNKIRMQGHIQSRRIYGNIVEFVPTIHMQYEF